MGCIYKVKTSKRVERYFLAPKIDARKRVLGLKCWALLKKNVPFIWDDHLSFDAVKTSFASAPLLSPPESGGYFVSQNQAH